MKYSWCVPAVLVAISAGCATADRPKPLSVSPGGIPGYVRVKPGGGGPARRVALEDYVRATIISEFAPPSGDPALVERMLEVQAVIARTYAVAHLARHRAQGYDLCSSTHCQLYEPSRLKTSMWAAAAAAATASTAGMVLWYDSGPARALFHADCGGHTSAVSEVWEGAPRAYLKAQVDGGPASAAHTSWRFDVSAADLTRALNKDPRTRVGSRLRDIVVSRRDDGGRAEMVALRGARDPVVRGEELRAVLVRAFGPKSVRSTLFAVERRPGGFVFAGRGYGHGVGLCQAGALARLKAGSRPEQVLSLYYPGTRLFVLR
jgi:stage II sporulation protein D